MGTKAPTRQADAGQVDGAELHLLDDGFFLAELRAGIHFDLYAAAGAFGHESRELVVAFGGRIIGGVGLREAEHDVLGRDWREDQEREGENCDNLQNFH